MKKLISIILVAMFAFLCLPVAGAAETVATEKIEFEDGSYLIVETIRNGARASGTVSGSKPYTYYSASGTALWKVTLNGTFTYTGSSATCTASSVSTTIYNTSWSTSSKSASKSGSKATGSATMKQTKNGLTSNSIPVSLSLSCSASGTLS